MDSKALRYLLILLLSVLVTAAMTGCATGETTDVESASEEMAGEVGEVGEAVEEAGEAVAAELNEAAVMVLAKVDGMDGAEDMVVTKCPGCALAMDGSAEFAAHMGDYELHFCSEECMTKFNENPVEAIMALELPELDPAAILE